MSGPKLLEKKVVNAEVASQKKQLIDSGLAIAKKVDVLRESLRAEEQSLETFRTESVKKVQIEIDSRISVLEGIKGQIKDRTEELALLQVPLDQKWEDVNKAQEICDKWEQKLEGRTEYVSRKELELEGKEKEIVLDKERIDGLKERATEKIEEADNYLTMARNEADKIRRTAQVMLTKAEKKEKEVTESENNFVAVLKQTDQREKRLSIWEQDLAERESSLADKYATLERTINRLKK